MFVRKEINKAIKHARIEVCITEKESVYMHITAVSCRTHAEKQIMYTVSLLDKHLPSTLYRYLIRYTDSSIYSLYRKSLQYYMY